MAGNACIDDYLRSRIEAGDLPGVSYLIAEGDRVMAEGALGHAALEPRAMPARSDTLYDLASLTKPLATALLLVQLHAEGSLRLDEPLARRLPLWSGPDPDGRSRLTMLDLLAHRSGLPAWKPLYVLASDREERISLMFRMPLVNSPGGEVVYSDLGYILLGFALEEVTGVPLDRLFRDRVARPLGLEDLLFRPPRSLRTRIAPTETGNAHERELAGPEGRGYNDWRQRVIHGEVHDHNAHSLGGVAGHAGIFGTARAVFAIAREFLDRPARIIPEGLQDLFRTGLTAGLSQDRAVGFQLASTRGCSAWEVLAPRSFGHVGFTGTSLWIDPGPQRIYILLTNRVHPRVRETDMTAIRQEFHRIAAGL